jgi:hypothetical protein
VSGFGLQDAAAAGLAVLALAWLVRRRLRARRAPTPACEDCPANTPSARSGGGLVSIGEPREGDR